MLLLRTTAFRLTTRTHRMEVAKNLTSALFSTSSSTMAKEYKLKGLTSLDLDDGQMQECEVDGIKDGKVLVLKSQGKVHATSPKCTHYGAPLKSGVLSSDGRLTCPWHGACFNVATGDVEDAPALDPIAKFEIVEKDGAVYIMADEDTVKSNRSVLDIKCSAQGGEKVLVVGGGSGTTGVIEELRKSGFKGHVTVLSRETEQPLDRTKLSKALIDDISKVAWRSKDFYKSASIDIIEDEVTAVDFPAKSVSTKSGKSYDYTKLVLAPGGTPKYLPLPGLKKGELENIFVLRTIEDTASINAAVGDSPKKIVVVGTSFIGLEVGNALAGKKHDVTLVGMDKVPTELIFGEKLGKIFQSLLEKSGVKFHMSAEVSHAEPSSSDKSKVGSLHLKDGTSYPCDVLIQGVGVGPATQFLKESKGAPSLEKDGGVSVDSHFKVKGLTDVYAIGDIAKYPYKGHDLRIEHWNVAQNAGRQVARDIAGKPIKEFTPIFWSALGMQLRYCGNNAIGYDDIVINGSTEVGKEKQPSFAAFYCKGQDVVAVATMGKDPVMSQSAELMRRGKMPSKKDLESGIDILSKDL